MTMIWQPIETAAQGDTRGNFIVWAGGRYTLAWLDEDDGWHDATAGDYHMEPMSPQPTMWLPIEPPNIFDKPT